MPTGAEKLVWGEGDGSTHKVVETEFGRLGSLICGEHVAVLPGFVLGSMAEQIHISSWVEPACIGPDMVTVCSRYHAMAYNTYVICSQGMIDQQVIDFIGGDYGMHTRNTWAGIIEPGTGEIISNSLPPDQEGIVYAECDLEKCVPGYFFQEPTGFYMGKQFQLFFNDQETKPFNIIKRDVLPEKEYADSENFTPYDPFEIKEEESI
jgi:predicted amidohydrolase